MNVQRPTKKGLKTLSVKTRAGTFLLEMSAKGLCVVRFPRQPLSLRPGPFLGRVLAAAKGMKYDLTGRTLFEKKVYRTLQRVPAGSVVTYGELARRAGYPGAARAVGSAMRKNRLPVVIPCHRVVPAAGGLGDYSAGKQWKCLLLANEKNCAKVSGCQSIRVSKMQSSTLIL